MLYQHAFVGFVRKTAQEEAGPVWFPSHGTLWLYRRNWTHDSVGQVGLLHHYLQIKCVFSLKVHVVW